MSAHVVAYVSGHGFGHAAREIEILRHLPHDMGLTIKTSSPEWFWREEMGSRPFDFVADSFDVGCVQKDSLHVDVSATLRAWEEVDTRNRFRLESECEELRRRNVSLVVSDVAGFPLTVAARQGIPGVLVANFTWADIYAAFVEEEPRFAPHVARLTEEYKRATLTLDTAPSLPMPYLARREAVGMVARPGVSRREELSALVGPGADGKRLALVYLGGWGYPLPYAELESFTDWHFLSLQAPPVPVANWTIVPRTVMGHSSLVASVDLVVSKPGYGIVTECVSQGTPLLYCPRPSFAEYPALASALVDWPGGLCLPENEFLALSWQEILPSVPKHGTIPPRPAPGGRAAAHLLTEFVRHGENGRLP